jgi:hypothetical protein
MRPSLWDYVREAFNARPIGMFVAPNWAMLAGFGMAGYLHDPGWLVLGAGLELGYLLTLATNGRFQRFVAGKLSAGGSNEAERKLAALFATLPDADQRRHKTKAQRCQSIHKQQFQNDTSAPGYASQSDSLSRLTWMYLRLLVTRQAILRVVREGARSPGEPPPVPAIPGSGQVLRSTPPPVQHGTTSRPSLEQRLAELRRRLQDPELGDDLRRSLESQAELLEQRVARRGQADEKLAFLDAELTRIEEQVELIREQAVLSTDPVHLSQRIDEISATLGSTGDWIADQQNTIGAMDDLISDPPPLSSQTRVRQSN